MENPIMQYKPQEIVFIPKDLGYNKNKKE